MFRGGYFGSFLESMMGGRQGGRQSSIDRLLEDSCTVEQLLNEGEILTECKWGNSKLMSYFNHDRVTQLIDLITKMPEEDCSHDRGHKHPFTVSEIFNCELGKVNDLFFQSRDDVQVDKKEVQSSPAPKDDTSEEEEDSADKDEEEEEEDEVKIITQETKPIEIPQVVMNTDEEFEKLEKDDAIEVLEESKEETEKPTEDSQPIVQEEQSAEVVEPTKSEELTNVEQQEEQEAESLDDVEIHEPLLRNDGELSTAPTTEPLVTSNKFELFERLLSFLEQEAPLNDVLSGYFSKVLGQLISNKGKEVYNYVYTHTQVLDNLVRHSAQKSISEVLVRLLSSANESLFETIQFEDVQSIRASFVFKIVQTLAPPEQLEAHLNAQQILTELAEQKPLLQEMLSPRCQELYIKYLVSDCGTTKLNTYVLLRNLVQKQTQAPEDDSSSWAFKKATAPEPADTRTGNEELFGFVCSVISEFASEELRKPEENILSHPKQYGMCKQPFGMLRMRVVEFIAEVFKGLYREALHLLFVRKELYNTLLYFFDHYPFHNLLHLKVHEVFMTVMGKSQGSEEDHHVVTQMLEETDLLRKILDTADNDSDTTKGTKHTMDSGRLVTVGYMPFIRKLANKLVDIQKTSDEVSSLLDSIPEWGEYVDNQLKRHNEIEAKHLGQDPRGAKKSESDDFLDMMFKFKDSQQNNKKITSILSNITNNNENSNDDEEEEEDEEDKFGATASNPILKGFSNDDNDEDDDEDDSQAVFDRIMLKHTSNDSDEEEDEDKVDSGIYSSNRKEEHPFVRQDTPRFTVEVASEQPEYHAQFYWKVEAEATDLDELLADYQ